jgi:mRNA interferase RelE/StbE
MKYVIQYSTLLNAKEVARFPKADLRRIKKAIEEKLTTQPELFGKPLRKSLRGYRSLRVGDYRVIFRIEEEIVKIFIIDHRSVVYEEHQEKLR